MLMAKIDDILGRRESLKKKKEKEKKEYIAKCSNNRSTVFCDIGLSDTGFLFKKTIFR